MTENLRPIKKLALSDKAVVYKSWSSGKSRNVTYHIYLMDETGVRAAMEAAWYWKKIKSRSLPFSKDRPDFTFFRCREQNVGTGPDKDYGYRGAKVIFVRNGG